MKLLQHQSGIIPTTFRLAPTHTTHFLEYFFWLMDTHLNTHLNTKQNPNPFWSINLYACLHA